MQQQIAQAAGADWPTLLALLGALFTLVCGAYVYTNRSTHAIYTWVEHQLENLKGNELKHLEERVKRLEDQGS